MTGVWRLVKRFAKNAMWFLLINPLLLNVPKFEVGIFRLLFWTDRLLLVNSIYFIYKNIGQHYFEQCHHISDIFGSKTLNYPLEILSSVSVPRCKIRLYIIQYSAKFGVLRTALKKIHFFWEA
jgi:hypothetical protein